MCGQGSPLGAMKDKKMPGKEPGKGSPSRTNSIHKGPEVAESDVAEHREGEGEQR